MSWFGNLISGVGNFIGGLFGGSSGAGSAIGSTIAGTVSNATQYSYARKLASQQQDFNRSNMAYSNSLAKDLTDYNYNTTMNSLMNSPGALRQGMESAGFNPILAYSEGNFTNAVSPGNSSPLGSTMPNAPNVDYIGDYTRLRNQRNQDALTNAQVENTNADTTIKKFGQKLAIIKNLKDLYNDSSVPEYLKKQVSARIMDTDNEISSNAIDSFKQMHPTTYRILKKLKNGDFKGVKYEIDHRRNRINNELNYHDVTSWNNSSKHFNVRYLKDNEINYYKHNYGRDYYSNRPPKNFPY